MKVIMRQKIFPAFCNNCGRSAIAKTASHKIPFSTTYCTLGKGSSQTCVPRNVSHFNEYVCWAIFISTKMAKSDRWFRGPSIISVASNLVFWTFFRAKTCCVVCHAYCFCYGGTNMARKMSENHIPFDFWDDSTLANQGAGKTIEKPLKELPWNQWWIFHCDTFLLPSMFATLIWSPKLGSCFFLAF